LILGKEEYIPFMCCVQHTYEREQAADTTRQRHSQYQPTTPQKKHNVNNRTLNQSVNQSLTHLINHSINQPNQPPTTQQNGGTNKTYCYHSINRIALCARTAIRAAVGSHDSAAGSLATQSVAPAVKQTGNQFQNLKKEEI